MTPTLPNMVEFNVFQIKWIDRRKVKEILDQLEPSRSPCGSIVMLVANKDGRYSEICGLLCIEHYYKKYMFLTNIFKTLKLKGI